MKDKLHDFLYALQARIGLTESEFNASLVLLSVIIGGGLLKHALPGISIPPSTRWSAAGDTTVPYGAQDGMETTSVASFPLQLNDATETELMSLPGVGPTMAARIVEDRRINGAFLQASDLERVRGIGPSKVSAWDSLLSFDVLPDSS